MKTSRTKILGFVLLLAGFALGSAGLRLLLSPSQYQATAIIKMEMDRQASNSGGYDYDPYFIQTEYETIQSQVILSNVISALNLNVEWGKKYSSGAPLTTTETVSLLRRHLRLKPVRGTSIFSISIFSEDPKEAASIANAIAMTYGDYYQKRRREMTAGVFQAFSNELQAYEKNIKAKVEGLDELGKQLNLPSPEPAEELLKSNYPAYYQARQELQDLLSIRKEFDRKFEADKVKVNLSIPKSPIVHIADLALPPASPAKPNRPLGAALLALGLFFTGGGFWLLKSSRHIAA